VKLTDTKVRELVLSADVTDKVFFDDDLPGFGVRVRSSGARRWLVQYDSPGGRTRRMTLGRTSALSATKARATARDVLAKVRLGQDPAGDKAAKRIEAAETISVILPTYLDVKRLELKPRSYDAVEHHLNHHAKALHSRPLRAIDLREAARLLEKVGARAGMTTRNRVRSSLAAFYNWARGEGLTENNPFAFCNKAPESGARKRTPTPAELAEIWHAVGDEPYGQLVRLLMLTGTRRDEMAALCWSERDVRFAGWITIPPERTKSGKEHHVPVTEPVAEILEACRQACHPGRDLVFGRGKGGFQHFSGFKRALDERINVARAARGEGPMPAWVLHDFRRSLSTHMHEQLGVAPNVVEACLGHVGVFKQGIRGVYNTAMYLDERRDAFERWAELLMAAVNGKTKPARGMVRLVK
jgi:integrase